MATEAPIILSTFGSLVRHGYRMDVSCHRCERSVTIAAEAELRFLSHAVGNVA